jgi:hypothetical protein
MSRLFNTLEMDRDFKRSSQAFPNSYGPFTGAQNFLPWSTRMDICEAAYGKEL